MRVQLHSAPCGCTVHPSKGLRMFNDNFSLQRQNLALPLPFFQVHGLWSGPSVGFLALPVPSSLLHETVQ